jgi:hypothetical protein
MQQLHELSRFSDYEYLFNLIKGLNILIMCQCKVTLEQAESGDKKPITCLNSLIFVGIGKWVLEIKLGKTSWAG